MQRRSWLRLGLFSASVMALGGGALALLESGQRVERLSPAGRAVFTGVGQALLDGSLPARGSERETALDGLLDRIDVLLSGLPQHAQAELSQLLLILDSSVGRRALAGLSDDWSIASIADIQAALQSMRTSGISLRRQAYQALHDITGSAYFSDSSTWAFLGYPGPITV